MRGLLLLVIGALLLATRAQSRAQSEARSPADPIAAGFNDVPPEARLRMFWRIFGPAWERSEIDYQLAELQAAGVGGVMTCFTYPISPDDPVHGIHNDTFLSPTFLDTLRYAATEAHKRQISFGVCGGTGWPYGGPTVSLHDAAQRLRMATIAQTGGRYNLPPLKAGEHVIAAFLNAKEITSRISNGHVDALPTDSSQLKVFIAGPTGMQVKRAALGGEGYVIDHLSRKATQHYLDSVVTPLAGSATDAPLNSLFCDSLEVYRTNWTHDFPEQFKRRRGYDLIPHLPDLFSNSNSEHCRHLRFDYWRTVAELAEDEFAATVHRWCAAHNISFALEAYGTPSMGFTAAQHCDVPWGEQYEWKGFSFSRFASSGGHLAGKKIIGAEAWTWAGIPNRLADSLDDLKLCSDLHFLAGENELTGVDFPYSPRAIAAPGWTPYYGPVMNQNNPQWPYFHYLAAYINRCQWLLRQGRPVADVALYVPTEDVFAHAPMEQLLLDFQLRDRFATGELTDEFGLQKAFKHHSNIISAILESGYNYDGIDFFAVNRFVRVEKGEMVAGDGRYRVVVLPALAGIDASAFRKLRLFCRSGGVIICITHLPQRTYGYISAILESSSFRLSRDVADMQAVEVTTPAMRQAGYRRYRCGKGDLIIANDDGAPLRAALASLDTPGSAHGPDVIIRSMTPAAAGYAETNISHVHRRVNRRDFFFIVNMGDHETAFAARFRTNNYNISIWNPLDGAISAYNNPILVDAAPQDTPELTLTLPSHGSLFVCLAPRNRSTSARKTLTPPRNGEELTLKIPWHIDFDGPDAPPPYETETLVSWTQWPGAKYFSGHATYTGSIILTEPLPKRCRLRFERVYEAGEVWINGNLAGAVWLPHYEIDVSGMLRMGLNTIKVTVGNLPVNRVLGLPDPDLKALHAVYGERFPAPEEKRLMSQPAPSGLVGAVTLVLSH